MQNNDAPAPYSELEALDFVGVREWSEFASWAKATDRAETCAELKELREESRWIFQYWCSWTCSLFLLGLFIVAILTVSWICVRSCTRRANVVADSDGSQKRGVASTVRVGGMVR